MAQKTRLLLSVGSLGMGGTEIFVMNLFRNLDKTQFQVDFVVYDSDRLEFYEEVRNAGSAVFFCTGSAKNSIVRLIQEMYRTFQVLQRGKYDVMHCHSCSFKGLFWGAIPGFLARHTKVIAHAHSTGTPKNTSVDRLLRRILRTCLSFLIDYGFSCSDTAGASKFTKCFLKSNRYYVIHNAVDTEKYCFDQEKRKKERERLGIENDSLVLGHVGRFEAEKNHAFLLEIFAQVHKQKKSNLLLIGEGSLLEEMKTRTQTMGIGDAVLFLGYQDSAAPFYQAMDCFVMPSHYEGFPFVLVEAQINGLNCVVSDVVTKSVNISDGVRFESLLASSDRWAAAVLDAGSSRMRPDQIEQVCTEYDLKQETRRIEGLYCKLLKMKS